MLASPSPVASSNTVYTRCSVLETKIVFYQKKISWLRRLKSTLEDSNQCKLYFILHRCHYPTHSRALTPLLIGSRRLFTKFEKLSTEIRNRYWYSPFLNLDLPLKSSLKNLW